MKIVVGKKTSPENEYILSFRVWNQTRINTVYKRLIYSNDSQSIIQISITTTIRITMKCAFDIMIILSKITYYILHYLPILVSIQYLINSKRLNKDLSYAQLAHIKSLKKRQRSRGKLTRPFASVVRICRRSWSEQIRTSMHNTTGTTGSRRTWLQLEAKFRNSKQMRTIEIPSIKMN